MVTTRVTFCCQLAGVYRCHAALHSRTHLRGISKTRTIIVRNNAGKSKIINAIIGQELLPSSATAMTTLPTEIVLKENAAEPILKLSPRSCEAFKKALDAIRQEI